MDSYECGICTNMTVFVLEELFRFRNFYYAMFDKRNSLHMTFN